MLVDSLCNLEKLARMRELESAYPAMRQCPHESWFMYSVLLKYWNVCPLVLEVGGWGVYETRNCLLISMVCVCVGYSCFKTSLVIPSLFATVPYNRHAQ